MVKFRKSSKTAKNAPTKIKKVKIDKNSNLTIGLITVALFAVVGTAMLIRSYAWHTKMVQTVSGVGWVEVCKIYQTGGFGPVYKYNVRVVNKGNHSTTITGGLYVYRNGVYTQGIGFTVPPSTTTGGTNSRSGTVFASIALNDTIKAWVRQKTFTTQPTVWTAMRVNWYPANC